MRYFFDSSGKCLAVITENPTGNVVPKEGANASYVYDGDAGRSTGQVFLDKTFVLRNGITVNLSAWAGTVYGSISFSISCSAWPINGLTVYAHCMGKTVSRVVTQDGTYSDIYVNGYGDVDTGVWVTDILGNTKSVTCRTCNCYSCDCGGGSGE